MDRKTRKLLRDALGAVEEILEYAQGVDLQEFTSDRMRRWATYYAFAVPGEALGKLDPAYRSELSDHPPAIDMRNRLIHGYSAVDAGIVWATVQQDIPSLREELQGLLDTA